MMQLAIFPREAVHYSEIYVAVPDMLCCPYFQADESFVGPNSQVLLAQNQAMNCSSVLYRALERPSLGWMLRYLFI